MLKGIVVMGLLLGVLLWAGCSTQKGVECALPTDCAEISHPECAGNWVCDTGKCVFSCAPVLTGDNETDSIGNQLAQVKADSSSQDLAYIDGLEKELSALTW